MTEPSAVPVPVPAQSAITWKDNKPIWDFAAITAYPIEIQQAKNSIPVYVYLTPYAPDELKAVLSKIKSGYRREKQDIDLVAADITVYTPLCDAHFVRLGNSTGTPEAQRMWLDKNTALKPSIVQHTFGGLRMDTVPETETDEMLDISVELSGSVNVFQEIYDPATDKVAKVVMSHNHSHPTETQYRDYRGARRSKFLRRTALWTVTEQHGTLEKLYDTVIQSIDGAAVDSKPCAASTKSEWLPKVPLWHKLWVVDHIFEEIVEKNG